MKSVQSYVKNVAKSMVFSAADVTKQMMPDVGEFAEQNKEFFTATYATLKNPGSSSRKIINSIQQSKVYQAIDYGAKNLIEDLKSGDFYNKERAERDEMKFAGLDTDWDDLSEFGIDENWEENLGKDTGASEVTKGDKQIINAINSTSGASTSSTVNAIIKSSQMEMENQRASTGMLYQQNERLFNGLHNDLSTVDTTLRGINNMLASSLQNIDTNMADYFTQDLKLSQERNAILKEMLEMQRNQYKTAAEREEEAAKKSNNRGGKLRWKDVSLGGGALDLGKYFDNVTNNIKNQFSSMGIAGFSEDSNMLATFMVAPMRTVTETLIKAIIPATIKEATQELNGTFSGMFGTFLGRASNVANRDEGGILGTIMKFLGINTRVNSKIDTSKYEKGPVSWDGISRKAITDVIPTYLRQIAAAVTGRPEEIFDYNTGRWNKAREAKTAHENIHKNAVRQGTGELRETMQYGKNAVAFDEQYDQEKFDLGWEEFWEYIYDNNGQFNPTKSMDQNHIDMVKYPNIRRFYKIYCTIWEQSEMGVYMDTSGKRRTRGHYSTRMQAAGKIMSAKDTEEQQYREAERNGGLISQYYAAGGPSGVDRHGKWNANGQFDYRAALLDARDKQGNTIFDYLYNLQAEIKWQNDNWMAGGGGYGGRGAGSGASISSKLNAGLTERPNVSLRNPEKIAQENRAAQNKDRKLSEYKKRIDDAVSKGKAFKASEFDEMSDTSVFLDALAEYQNEHAAEQNAELINQYVNENILTRYADKLYGAQIEITKEQKTSIVQGLENNDIPVSNQEATFLSKVFEKIKQTGNVAQAIGSGATEAVTNMLYVADKAIYDMFFKSEIKSKDGKKYNGFMEFFTSSAKNAFDNMTKKINDNIITPFKDRIKKVFDEDFKKEFTGTFKDVGKKVWTTFKDANKEVYGGTAHKIAKSVAPNQEKQWRYNQKVKERHAKEAANAPKTPDVIYVGTPGTGSGTMPDQMAEGELTNLLDATVSGYGRGYFSGNTMLSRNEVVLNSSGATRVSGTGLYHVSQPSVILNSSQAYDAGYTSTRGNPKADLSREQRMAHGMGLATNAEGTAAADAVIPGANKTVTENDVNEYVEEAKSTVKSHKGSVAAGGVIGGAVSAILGLVGGPLVGAAVGAGTTLIAKSDKFKDVIFGKSDEEGNRQGGLIPKTVMDTVNKYAPGALKFGLAGIIPGLLTPLGPLGGMLVGAGIGILKNNENFMNKYFGENGMLHFSDKEKKTITKLLPGAGKGAAIGAGASLLFGPFGMLGGAAIGSAIGMMTTTDEFKEGVMGKKLNNGQRVGGLLNGLKDTFRPLGEVFIDFGKRMRDLLDDHIVKPLKEFLVPAIHALPRALGAIPRAINRTFDEKFIRSMSAMLKDIIKGPVSKMVNVALAPVRGAANIATTPFRALGAAGRGIRKHQIKNQTADYMTAQERIQWMADNGYSSETPTWDAYFAGIGEEGSDSYNDAVELLNNMTVVSSTRQEAFGAAKNDWKAIEKYLDNFTTESGKGIDPKDKKAIRTALESGDTSKARELIRKARVQGTKHTLSTQEQNDLYNGGLSELMAGYSTSYDRYRAVANLTDESRDAAKSKLQQQFTDMGLEGFKLNNVDDVRKFMSLLNTEVVNRQAGGQGVTLEEDSNETLHDINQGIKDLLATAQDYALGNTEALKEQANKRKEAQKADEERMQRKQEATAADAKITLGDEKYNQLTDRAKDELTRRNKRGGQSKFLKTAAKKNFSYQLINATAGFGTGVVEELLNMGFTLTENAASAIVESGVIGKDRIRKFINGNVCKWFEGHEIDITDVNCCIDNFLEAKTFKNRCKLLAQYSGDQDISSYKSSFDSVMKMDTKMEYELGKHQKKTVGDKVAGALKAVGKAIIAPAKFLVRKAKLAFNITETLKKEGYNLSNEAEDVLYEYDLIEANQFGRFFNKSTKDFWKDKPITHQDVIAIQDVLSERDTATKFRNVCKWLYKAGKTPDDGYGTFKILVEITKNEKEYEAVHKMADDANKTPRSKIKNLFKKIGRGIVHAIGRAIGARSTLIKDFERNNIQLSENARDMIERSTHAEIRYYNEFFNKNFFKFFAGHEKPITEADLNFINENYTTDVIDKYKHNIKVLAKAGVNNNDYAGVKGVANADENEIKRLENLNKSKTIRGKIKKALSKAIRGIGKAILRRLDPVQAWRVAGFTFEDAAEVELQAKCEDQSNVKLLNEFFTTNAADYFKGKEITVSDINTCFEYYGQGKNFDKNCRILVNAGLRWDNPDAYTTFEGVITAPPTEIERWNRKKKSHTVFGMIKRTIRNRRKSKDRVRKKARSRLFGGLYDRMKARFGIGANAEEGGEEAPPVNEAEEPTVEPTEGEEGETVETNGIGTMLLRGAVNVGKAAVKGVKKVASGVKNFFSKNNDSGGGLISRARRVIGGGGEESGGSNGNRKAAAGVIDFGRGRIGKARVDSSGSITPDTSDSKTKQYVDEVAEEKSANDKLVEKQLEAAEATVASNDTSDYDKIGGKNKKGWIQLLLFGGLLWKSGILKKLYEGFIKPIWTNAIKPWITDKVVPWITDTAIPAIGDMLGKILPGIIKGALKILPSLFGGLLDRLSGNKRNAGASTTTNVNDYNDEEYKSTYYNEKGQKLSYEDVQNGNFKKLYNEQGAKGKVEYDNDGNVTNVTFKDTSVKGSSYAEKAVGATVRTVAYGGSKITKGVSKVSSKLLKSKSIIGKTAGVVGKAVNAPLEFGNAIVAGNSTGLAVAGTVTGETTWASKVYGKVMQLLDKMFNSEGRIAQAFNKMATKFGGTKAGSWLKNFKEQVKKIFKNASDKLTNSAIGQLGQKAKALLNKLPTRVIFAAVDFLVGMDKAEALLGVTDPGPGETVIAGILNSVINQIPILGMIPGATWIIQQIFKFLDKYRKNEDKSYEERQAEADAEAEAYNEAHGTTYSTEEYLGKTKSITGRITTKLTNVTKKALTATKSFIGRGAKAVGKGVVKYVKGIGKGYATVGKGIAKGAKKVAGTVKDSWNNISDKLQKMFTASDNGDIDALDAESEDDDEESGAVLSVVKAMISPTTQLTKCLGKVNESMSGISKVLNSDEDNAVIEKVRNGELSVFSKEYWNVSSVGTGLGGAFKKIKSFMTRLMNAPGLMIQGLFNKICKAISNIGSWIKDKFSWVTDFMDHPLQFIWNKIQGKSDEEAGTEDIDGTEISDEDLENVANEAGISADDEVPPEDTTATGYGKFYRKYGRGRSGRGYVKQIDPSIRNLPFNVSGDHEKQTIGDSACGPAAAVNAVKAFYGRGNELVSAANMAINGGYKEIDGGTYPEYFTDYFAKNGMGSTISTNTSNIAQRIRDGQPTVLMGKDSNGVSSSTPFGTQSHYVTVTGTDNFGRAIVQDPESRLDNQIYDVHELMDKTQLGISAYGKHRLTGRSKYRRLAAHGTNHVRGVKHFGGHHTAKGKYGRGTGNGIIFITDTAGYYINELMSEGGHDTNGFNNSANGYDWFESSGNSYLKTNGSKHDVAVIMLGLKDVGYADSRDNYESYVELINNNLGNWDMDIYVVSVNPIGTGATLGYKNNGSTTDTIIKEWNTNMRDAIEEYNSENIHFIDTYSLIKDSFVMDSAKVKPKVQGKGYKVANTNIFYNDETNKAIYDYILEEVVEYTGEEAVETDACSASSIMDGLISTISNWVMTNTKAGQLYSFIMGSSSESSDEEEDVDTDADDSVYGEEDDEDYYEDEEESGEGKYGRGKYGRAVRKAIKQLEKSKKNKNSSKTHGKYGRGKYGRGTSDKIWYVLKNAGLNEKGAAGLMGNLEAESGLLPNNLQNSYEKSLGMSDEEYTSAIDNGTYSKEQFAGDSGGYGLAQWTYSSRKRNLYNYAAQYNTSIADLAMQLGFLLNELNNGYKEVYNTLKNASSVQAASDAFMTKFERPADQSQTAKNKRASMGQEWYNKLQGTSGEEVKMGDGFDSLSSDSSSSSSTSVTDTMTSVINDWLADTKANKVFEMITGSSMVDSGSSSSSSSSENETSDGSCVSGDSDAAKIVNVALAEEGTTETRAPNYVKYNDWYYGKTGSGGEDKPWCAAFVSWAANQAGIPTNIITKSASTKTEYAFVTGNGGGKSVKPSEAQTGDLVYFTNSPNNASGIYHTGIVVDRDNSTLYTIEGNTSNAVHQRSYETTNSKLMVARPAYTNQGSSSTSASFDTSSSVASTASYANTRGGNANKPISKYGTFKRGLYGTGQRRKIKTKDGSFYAEESDVDEEIGLRMKAAEADTGRGSFGRAASVGETDKYGALLEAVLKVLVTIADNTDRLNTIVNLISNYIDLNASDTDVADATKAQSLKSKLNGLLGGIDGANATNKLSNMADNTADGSIATIINAMNMIASE